MEIKKQFFSSVHNYSAGRALTSDWSVNSFIMVIYETLFLMYSQNFLYKHVTRKPFS